MSPLLLVLLCFGTGCAFWFGLCLLIMAKDEVPVPEEDEPWVF